MYGCVLKVTNKLPNSCEMVRFGLWGGKSRKSFGHIFAICRLLSDTALIQPQTHPHSLTHTHSGGDPDTATSEVSNIALLGVFFFVISFYKDLGILYLSDLIMC